MTTWPGQEEAAQWPGQEEVAAQPQWPGQEEVTSRPGLGRYGLELGKGVVEGGFANIGTRLQGYGAGVAGTNAKILDVMNRVDTGQQVTPIEDVIGYQDMTPEQRQQTRKDLQQNLEVPATQQPLYKAGEAVSKFGADLVPPAHGFENSVTRDVGKAIGSGLENIAEVFIPVVGPAVAIPNMAAAGAGEAAATAVQNKATNAQQIAAAGQGTLPGLTELVDALLPIMGTPGKAISLIRRVATRVVQGIPAEAGQEGLQQLLQNMIAKGIYKPDQDVWEGVPYNALLGGIAGGAISGTLGGHGGGVEAAPTATSDQQSAAQVREVLSVLRDTSPTPESSWRVAGKVQAQFGPTLNEPAAPQPQAISPDIIPPQPQPTAPLVETTPQLHNEREAGLAPEPSSIVHPERWRRVQNEVNAIIEETRRGWEEARRIGLKIEPSPEYPVSSATNLASPRTAGDVVASDYRPTTTVVPTPELIAGRFPAEQMVEAMAGPVAQPLGGEVVPQLAEGYPAKIRIYFDPTANLSYDLVTYHTAQVSDWLDSIRPRPVRAEDNLNALMHEAMTTKIKQLIPENVQVHIVPRSEMIRLRSAKGDGDAVKGLYFAADENAIAPTILIPHDIMLGDPSVLSHVVLHESVHGVTVEALSRQDAIGTNLRTDVRILMNEAQRAISFGTLLENEARGGTTNDIQYGFTNEKEFIAEAFSNPFFQHVLMNIKMSREALRALRLKGKPTIFQGLVQRLREFLRLPNNAETYSLLEATIRIGDRIMDIQQRLPGSEMKPVAWEVGFAENRKVIDQESKEIEVSGRQPETEAIMLSADALFGRGKVPLPVAQAAAWADRAGFIYRYFAGLTQLARSNPNHRPLLSYTEDTAAMNRLEVQIQDAAVRVAKDWHSLGEQGYNLSAFIDDIGHMRYRDKLEVDSGIVRHPSAQEVQRLITKHKLEPKTIQLFKRITQMISGDPQAATPAGQRGFLGMMEDSIIEHIQNTIQDQAEQLKAIQGVQQQVQDLRKRPYFPFTHFGNHYVVVKDPSGRIIHAETVERGLRSAKRVQQGLVNQLARSWEQQYGAKPTLQKDIIYGQFPDHVTPMIGMPGFLLNYMTATWELTTDQINAAQMLHLAEITGNTPMLAKRAQRRYYVPGYGLNLQGYSTDLIRSFSRFFFHGAKFYAKSKYLNRLKGWIEQAKQLPGNKEAEVAQFMGKHLKDTVVDQKGGWGQVKGLIFLWSMGYVPAAAAANMTQTPFVTFPFLNAKFGEHKSSFHILKAMAQVSTYYKYGSYQNQTAFDYKALEYGIRTGRITETQAPELAALSQSSLLHGAFGSKVERSWQWIMQHSGTFFQAAEQFNRRIAYRAALNLALNNPRAKYIDQAVKHHQTEYQQLLVEGYSDVQARAIVTAVDTVDQTQYVYAAWDQPVVMRGGLRSTVLIYKKYVQSTFFMLGQNKDVAWRYMLLMILFAGLKGLPGMEDIFNLTKGVMKGLFGKDFDLDREVRKMVLEITDGTVDPDLVLHGLARRGFGIPWLLDGIGSFATGTPGRGIVTGGAPIVGKDPNTGAEVKRGFGQNVPFPVLDRSRAVSAGQVLPIDLSKVLAPGDDLNRTIADQAQKASGAGFSVAFNMFKAINDSQMPWTDPKRWERALPRVLGDATKSFRAFTEGRERTKGGPAGGSTLVTYDTRDTEQMMEAFAIALGYQTLREQTRWDNIMAQLELTKYYDMKRQGLMAQYYEAHSGKLPEEIEKVRKEIETYNNALPEWAKSQAVDSKALTTSVEGKYRARTRRELGLPAQNMDIPLAREIDRLHPESVIDVRRPAGR